MKYEENKNNKWNLSQDYTWMGDYLKTSGAGDMTKARLHYRSIQVKHMDGKLFQGVHALGKLGLWSGQLVGNCVKAVPQIKKTWF